MRTQSLSQEAIEVLGSMECEALSAKLGPAQLPRKLYEEVNKVLVQLGGKWNRKAQAHVFEDDPRDVLDQIVLAGSYEIGKTKKQEFGFFETPSEVGCKLIGYAELDAGMRVLEPSAGRGALALPLLGLCAELTCVELQDRNFEVLSARLSDGRDALEVRDAHHAGTHLILGDFLAVSAGEAPWPAPLGRFDRIIMNPPFAREAYAEHIITAAQHLAPGGRLVSVAPTSVNYRTTRKTTALRELIEAHGCVHPLPPDSFKESGTNVNTCIVILEGEK